MKPIVAILVAFALTVSCKQNQSDKQTAQPASQNINLNNHNIDSIRLVELRNEHMVLSTLYQQKAGEYRALCYQAFNLGKVMLDKDLTDKSVDKHRIIVLDVDETVLDNSPFQAKCILESTTYPVNWDEWCKLAKAKALPGAIEFLKYAKSNGLDIYYVTNRKIHLKEFTVKNLNDLGFPDADNEHVIMRTTVDSKEPRRQELMEKYHISLFFGDNLNDFSDVFEKKDSDNRAAEVDMVKAMFGQRFIVLPNAMYGDWELALYGFDQKQDDSVKYEIRRKALISF
ncbi:MAG: 5'-nucleotidase, lipoprotein e(P4) family [Bacteroidetes bacterium HGW-Bacteroidetes-9]|nr:MAG: 5'-nucleotidase, lipoprotein e(P4) family [Bacteroidetes bacterium HGW-Bacteroidetes-9]